jgi:hypothetical protein
MMEPIKNVAASILSRLRSQAELLERPFAEILQYYAMERFLFRLSKTNYIGVNLTCPSWQSQTSRT